MEEDREEQRDLEYWMQLYPAQTRRIQREVEHQCDLLDYDGSVIYDDYPDRIALSRICEAVYQALMQQEASDAMRQYPMGMPDRMPNRTLDRMSDRMPDDMSADTMSFSEEETDMDSSGQIAPQEEPSEPAYDFRSGGIGMMQADGRNLQDLIEILLFNEIHRRRRRRRRRHSWYFGG